MTTTDQIIVHTDVEVRLLAGMGTDRTIASAAMVSTGKDGAEISDAKLNGLIRYLMSNRHGSPFEQASMRFYIAAPIFVFREFFRHRIGVSSNEMSGRYTEMLPEFYLPGPDRPMINVGSSARPEMVPGDAALTTWFNGGAMAVYEHAWTFYKQALARGVAKEVARIPLPVGIFSKVECVFNPRSLMHFISLRTHDPEALFPSHPQYEIELVARKLETELARLFPVTHAAFNEARRVAP